MSACDKYTQLSSFCVQCCMLTLQVVDAATAAPLSGACFTLHNAASPIMSSKSDAEGLVKFPKTAPGSYTLRQTAAAQAYIPLTQPLCVEVKEACVTCDGCTNAVHIIKNRRK